MIILAIIAIAFCYCETLQMIENVTKKRSKEKIEALTKENIILKEVIETETRRKNG